jgi:dihydrofolate synthase/folylpolyglutamate synthase
MYKYTYEEVLDRIENSRRFGNLPGSVVTGTILKKLGEPQRGLPFIHVAGTNGKGSTCAFLSRILQESGAKVGCFTSPHLMDFCERICINGQMIPRREVTRLGNRLLAEDFGVTPTMFDYCLVMAVLYFVEQGCDVAVFETGLGGRLDSTNALGNPQVAVITRIGYDHMAILGDTLEEIAGEKAGILKPGVPAVFAPQEPQVLQVLQEAAAEKGLAEPGFVTVVTEADRLQAEAMHPGLPGAYQLENAATAMRAARIYFAGRRPGLPQKRCEQCIQRGIANARWPGRMEILSEHPFLMVDGAHNSNGIHALRTSLEELYPGERFHFVMAVMADKDYEQMVEELLPLALDFVTVTPESARALQGEALAATIRKKGVAARSLQSVSEVLFLPVEGERTVALGSLYFIGELKALWGRLT